MAMKNARAISRRLYRTAERKIYKMGGEKVRCWWSYTCVTHRNPHGRVTQNHVNRAETSVLLCIYFVWTTFLPVTHYSASEPVICVLRTGTACWYSYRLKARTAGDLWRTIGMPIWSTPQKNFLFPIIWYTGNKRDALSSATNWYLIWSWSRFYFFLITKKFRPQRQYLQHTYTTFEIWFHLCNIIKAMVNISSTPSFLIYSPHKGELFRYIERVKT